MYTLVKKYLNTKKRANRKSFNLEDLEKSLMEKSVGASNYQQKGGYLELCNSLEKLTQEGSVKPMKTVRFNGKYPPLKIRWHIVEDVVDNRWRTEDILRLSDLLDFSTYIKKPRLQTPKEWGYILKIYGFLKNREKRQWASCEERCLELFDNEKFLDTKEVADNGVLGRLKLSYEDLKMKKYGQMFVYWNRGVSRIKTAVILENHSTFFSYKRAAVQGHDIFGMHPDAIIYGQGKEIIKSFSFIKEIANVDDLKIFYFGDVDPEGYLIYRSLKSAYDFADISLQLDAYKHLIDLSKSFEIKKAQNKNPENLNFIVKELQAENYHELAAKIEGLWSMNRRVPQEFITYEYLILDGDKNRQSRKRIER